MHVHACILHTGKRYYHAPGFRGLKTFEGEGQAAALRVKTKQRPMRGARLERSREHGLLGSDSKLKERPSLKMSLI